MHIDAAKFKIVMDALFGEIRDAYAAGMEARIDSAHDPADAGGTRRFTFTLPSHDAIQAGLRRRQELRAAWEATSVVQDAPQ